jgi:hypothetical protein
MQMTETAITTEQVTQARHKNAVRYAAAALAEQDEERQLLTGRKAQRAYQHGHAWIGPTRQGPHRPERSRCQRKTNVQRRANAKTAVREAKRTRRRTVAAKAAT